MKICTLEFKDKNYIEKEIKAEIIRFRLNEEEYIEISTSGENIHIRSMTHRELVILPRAANVFNIGLK